MTARMLGDGGMPPRAAAVRQEGAAQGLDKRLGGGVGMLGQQRGVAQCQLPRMAVGVGGGAGAGMGTGMGASRSTYSATAQSSRSCSCSSGTLPQLPAVLPGGCGGGRWTRQQAQQLQRWWQLAAAAGELSTGERKRGGRGSRGAAEAQPHLDASGQDRKSLAG